MFEVGICVFMACLFSAVLGWEIRVIYEDGRREKAKRERDRLKRKQAREQ